MKFSQLIGQATPLRQIREALDTDKLAHALLLRGPDGVGKLAFATALAQYLNCLQPADGDSCGICRNCIKISRVTHPDVRYILPIISSSTSKPRFCQEDIGIFQKLYIEDPWFGFDRWKQALGGDNKQLFISVEEIRNLKRSIYLKVAEGKYKVVIVWNADRINLPGANAFLKLLEEPPEKTILILTTSQPTKLIPTILSRCQQIRMLPLTTAEVENHLISKRGLSGEEAHEIAAISEGSISTALGYLDSTHKALKSVLVLWLRTIYTGKYDEMTAQNEVILKESKEGQKYFLQLAQRTIRNALLYSMGLKDIALADREERAFQENFSKSIDAAKVEAFRAELEEASRQLAGNANGLMVMSALSMRLHRILRS